MTIYYEQFFINKFKILDKKKNPQKNKSNKKLTQEEIKNLE